MSTSPSRTPMAGGFLLALSVIAGVVIGMVKGQPSLGVVIGAGVGIALAAAVWLADRARR